MVNVEALLNVLPISALEPDRLAWLDGFSQAGNGPVSVDCIELLEPPAGQHVPYIEPFCALNVLLCSQGEQPNDAQRRAVDAVLCMHQSLARGVWVRFFDSHAPDGGHSLPVSAFVAWMRACGPRLLVPDWLDFIEHAAQICQRTPLFTGPDHWGHRWSLQDMPALPPPRAMIEYLVSPPWCAHEGPYWRVPEAPFMRWREAMRPVACQLASVLGEPVYHFADPPTDLDDDWVHRFLVLHWCCTCKPQSAFVRYLQHVSGARDVQALRAALLDPGSYTHPFLMNDASIGMEASARHMHYQPPR